MALEISYWGGTDTVTRQIYGQFISAESLALSGASAQSGLVPPGAAFARIEAVEACRVIVGVAPVATATSAYLPAGRMIEMQVRPGEKVAGITA